MWDAFNEVLSQVFGGDVPQQPLLLYQVAARAAIVYAIGLALVRTGKSRLIGRSTALDVILGFMFGSLLARGITGSASLSGTAASCTVLVAIHWVLTGIAFRSHAFGNLIKGRCYLLVENGQLKVEAMRQSHITEQDLLEALRLRGQADDIGQIDRAYKERSGEVSVITRQKPPQVMEVRVENGVQIVRIELSG